MEQKITPCLWFEMNNAEEAMNFYTSVFPNSKIEMVQKYPKNGDGPLAGMEGKVLTGIFYLNGQKFMCLDGGPIWSFTGAVSFEISCDSQEEIDHYWSRLSAVPEAEQCGWVKDKYGLSWQIVPKKLGKLLTQSNKEGADRVMHAMLQMKKIIIADLEKAASGA
jgi:predicted 3-demethylubiquinone-9 3-methyltransferase (glyoxalase superfamily)